MVNLLNTPLAGNQLAIDSPLNLPLGSLLSAQVQGSQSLAFLPLSGRLDQLVLGQQLAAQQNRQASLEGLFKGLQGLAGTNDALRGSIDKLLGALPDSSQLSTAKGLAQALEGSGLLLEAKLLQGQTSGLAQDLKANLLRLIAQLAPQLPGGAGTLTGLQNALNQNLPNLARQLLGVNANGTARQQALTFPLPSRLLQNMDGEADLETLLKLAAAAISRLQTHQLSSLAQTQVDANGNLLTTWQLELPMRHQQEVIPLQIKLQREEQNAKGERNEPKETLWRIDLAFDLDYLGPLQVRAQLLRGSLSSQLWAERADTASLISAELGNLRERLQSAGLEVGELACSQGMPPQGPKTSLEQRWVDENRMSRKTPPEARQAIALNYDGQSAPILSAKGDDELAEAILAIAREYEVPIYENAELVRLLARLELGDAIPESLYRCIAEIIAFAWYLQGKAPEGFTPGEETEHDVTPPLPRLSGPTR